MAITVSVNFNIASDPNQAMIDAFCGSFNYQNLIPTISGLVPNPQSSGDFSRSIVSGYVIGIITQYNIQKGTGMVVTAATSGVNGLVAMSGSMFTF